MKEWIYICLTTFVSLSLFGNNVADGQTVIPNIDGSLSNVTFVQGQTAILECYIEDLGQYKVGWVRNETRLLSIEEGVITDDIRLSIERPKAGQWNLHIKNITLSDHGQYICRINTDPVTSKYVTLNVVVPAKIRHEVSSSNTNVREGETLTLTCKASGIPAPEIQWNKGWEKLKLSVKGDTLKIENVTRQDRGFYRCIASNVYTLAQREIKVTVEFAPEIIMTPKEIGHSVGGMVYQVCKIYAVPTPRIYWMKDNVSLESTDNDMYESYPFHGYPDNTLSSLTLRMSNLQPEQFGVYTCVAQNTAGNDSESVLIYAVSSGVQTNQSDTNNNSNDSFTAAPEVIPYAKRVGQYLGGEVILECMITGATSDNMYWLKDNVTLEFFSDEYFKEYELYYDSPEDYIRLKIEKVRKSQFGEYKCCAENSHGSAFKTIVLYEIQSDPRGDVLTTTEVTTNKEESGDAPKVSLQAKVIGQIRGRGVVLECIIVASPHTNMYWMKDNATLASLNNNSYQEESVPDGHVTKLRLKLLSLQDCQFGRYSCHAENSFGEDFDTVLVYDYMKGLPLEEKHQKLNGVQEDVTGVAASVLHSMLVMIVVFVMKTVL